MHSKPSEQYQQETGFLARDAEYNPSKAYILWLELHHKAKNELIKAYEDYVAFLGNYVTSLAGYLAAHNMLPNNSIVQKGQELRNEINNIKSKQNDVELRA